MLAIAHFAFGASIAFAILIWYPQIIPNFIKNDIFFIGISGLWALLPDLNQIITWFPHGEKWQNIFWGHTWIDSVTKDDPRTAAIFIGIAILIGYLYYKKIGGS